MADARFDITKLKPVLAYVGATDLAVGKVRDVVADAQKRAAAVQRDVTARVSEVQKQAADPQAVREAIEARVAALQAEALAYPVRVQRSVDESLTGAYTDLVERGQSLVRRVRRQKSTQETVAAARTTKTKARTTATQARKVAGAEIAGTEVTTTETAPAKSPAKKTTAKKSPAKKTTARKSTAKKAPAKTSAGASSPVRSSAKATVTSAQKTAASAAQAVTDAAEKVGD